MNNVTSLVLKNEPLSKEEKILGLNGKEREDSLYESYISRAEERARKRRIRNTIRKIVQTLCLVAIITGAIYVGVVTHTNITNQKTIEEQSAYIAELTAMVETQSAQIAELEELTEQMKIDKEEYEILKERSELYDEYGYVLSSTNGKRTDMTYDQLKHGIKLMEDANLNPHMLFSIVMIESGGNQEARNKTSNARGYCQLMEATARSYYKLLGYEGTYNHDMAYDGYLNLEMGALHLKRDMEKHGNVRRTLNHYSGGLTDSYWNKFQYYLGLAGTSAAELESSYKKAKKI